MATKGKKLAFFEHRLFGRQAQGQKPYPFRQIVPTLTNAKI